MAKMDKSDWRWTIILGETEIFHDDKVYTLVVGYVEIVQHFPPGPYIRLWDPDGKFIAGSWTHYIVNSIETTYFHHVPEQLIKKCLDFAYRVEKLRVFA